MQPVIPCMPVGHERACNALKNQEQANNEADPQVNLEEYLFKQRLTLWYRILSLPRRTMQFIMPKWFLFELETRMPLTRRTLLGSALSALATPAFATQSDVRFRRTYVDGPFGQIHVRVAHPATGPGTKPALACFHHSPGSGRLYDPLLPYLAKDRLVMAFDTPGYGNSSHPKEQPEIADYARALAVAIEDLTRGKPVDVMGQLTGSLIAVELAATRPDLVRRVVLSRSPVFSEETRTSGVAEMLKRHGERKIDAKADYLVDRLTRGLGRLAESEPPERYIGAFIDSVLPGHNWVYGEVAAFSYRADLNMPKITQPTLFITWIEDDAKDGEFGRISEWTRGADIIPNAIPLNLNGLGNWPWQENPEAITGPVLAFLDNT